MRQLPIVSSDAELPGSAPERFERLCFSATLGTRVHRGLVATSLALVRDALRMTIPPSALPVPSAALAVAQSFCRGESTEKEVRAARSLAFSSLEAVETAALTAFRKTRRTTEGSGFSVHADHVVERYLSLATYFSIAALCHVLDAVEEPKLLLESLRDQTGARAYLRAGLGAANNPQFRERARAQASFEAERPSSLHQEIDALSLQIFHEYLGARWRSLAADERARTDLFVTWALSSEA